MESQTFQVSLNRDSEILHQASPEPEKGFGRLLAVSQKKRSGLILCKAFHAEFAGPGAAIQSQGEQDYTAVIALGAPEIVEVVTPEERQQAYSLRIQWVRWLHNIVKNPEPLQRAEKLCSSFEEFFGSQILVGLPDSILALMAGVVPETIATVRSQHRYLEQLEAFENVPEDEHHRSGVVALNPQTFQVLEQVSLAAFTSVGITEILHQLPCSV